MALLLLEADVRHLLTMDHALDAVEDAFRSVTSGEAANFPRQRGALPGVTLSILSAMSTKLDAIGIKSYPIVRQDVTVGSSFTMLVYKISTGALDAILEASTLGQIRTGAASGVATKYMARPDSRIMTLFGAGFQAERQVQAIARALPRLERVNVVSRSPERARGFCDSMMKWLDLDMIVARDNEQAVSEADVITTATGARKPVFDGGWLRPGVHINAIGSNFSDKQELDATAVRRATRIVVDDMAVAESESGDLIAAHAQVGLDWSSIRPISDIVCGLAPGRASPEEISLFESHGIGLEDLAVACRVLERAREHGIGTEIPIR
jgi:ornithine cyclodeaminase/alanine dehydrogenase-like protein (mu-crystallin family)